MQEGKYKNDSTVYTNDSLWVNYFCGLAILPLDFNGTTGATFATTLAESGMMLYGRNRDSVDATLIRDTLQTLFYFYDEYATTYGNVSVNTVERTNTRYIDYDAIVEKPGGGTVEPQQPFELGYVEGMGGALVELTLTDEFLSVLGELQAEQEDEGYRTVAINQALLSIYVDGVTDGGWEQGFSQKVIERFDASISRLGLYTDFKTLTPVSDYAYDYEQQYEVTLPYGGYLNRSLGCYTLNISSHIQRLWRADRSRNGRAAVHRGPEADDDALSGAGGHRSVHLQPHRVAGRDQGRRERPDPHGVDLYADKIETAFTHCFLRT